MMAGVVRYGVPRELQQRQTGNIGAIGAGSIPRIQFSTGAAKALYDFSDMMFSISDRIEDRLDQQAQAEGEVQGALAGATGNFEVQDYTTIRSRAYNKAGIDTFVSTMETNTISKIAELQSLYGTQPDKLEQEMKNYQNGVAEQIDKVHPGAGAIYRQRSVVRSLPAIEQAKDAAYKLSRDEADAAIIKAEVALNAEIKNVSADLFSDNPARSQAAAQAIGLVQREVMRVYSAVDPVTGRPLFSPKERELAKQKFYEDTMTAAALGWFDGQEDKAGAYIKFTEGKFPIALDTAPAKVNIIDATGAAVGGKKRQLPVKDSVRDMMATAVAATDPTLSVKMISGGQYTAREVMQARKRGDYSKTRTGSVRHDHGGAVDLILVRNGKEIRPDDDPALYERFFENAGAAGFGGMGHYDWGVHVGGGSRAFWGPNKSADTANPRFAAAAERGWSGEKLDSVGGRKEVDLREALPPAALERLESEMRSRITFQNQIADREERLGEKALKANQDAVSYVLSDRLFNGGQKDENGNTIPPLDREAVNEAVRTQQISPAQGEAFMKALSVEPPERSNEDVKKDALRRVYAGENIMGYVLANSWQLSAADQSDLLAKNQTLNVAGEGAMSQEAKFHYGRLEDVLTPDSVMMDIDKGAETRKFSALDEFRQRTREGESPRVVADELAERAEMSFKQLSNTATDKLVRPDHAVFAADQRSLDLPASAKALKAAYDAGQINEANYRRQIELLAKWERTQRAIRK
jgi:hypothetical protein